MKKIATNGYSRADGQMGFDVLTVGEKSMGRSLPEVYFNVKVVGIRFLSQQEPFFTKQELHY